MKNKKASSIRSYDYFDDEDENYTRNAKKKRLEKQDRRRPVKNYKSAWSAHEKDYEERDEFFGK